MQRAAPHSHALRFGRFSEENRIYVVTSVTHKRELLFLDISLGRIFVKALRHQEATGQARTLAYVVMPDHFHWLLELGAIGTLSGIVRAVKGTSAHGMNARRGTAGRVWQPGFHDRAVRREDDIAAVARYIVANPVRAGLVKSVREYALWDAVWLKNRG